MKKRSFCKILALITCVLITLTLLCSCGATSKDSYRDESITFPTENGSSSGGSNKPGADYDHLTKDEIEDKENENQYEAKIIRTADLSAETKEFDAAVAEIEKTVKELGGYIQSSNVRGQNYTSNGNYSTRYASFTLRIPADRLDAFLSTAGELLNVTHSTSSAIDVSSDYYDIEARLSVLETERQLLEEMLSKSNSVNQMLEIETRLYDVIYEIESYKTMLKSYDGKVAYSTVNLNLSEVSDLSAINTDPSFGSRFVTAVSESWKNFVDFCQDFLIWLIYALPTLIILALIFVAIPLIVIFSIRRKCRRKAAKRKAAEQNNG